MANPEHLAKLKEGAEKWNAWRRSKQEDVEIDLSDADLAQVDLSRADLSVTNLNRANLRGANLSHADLLWANLSGVNLRESNLFRASLTADLSRANLSGADLTGADFSGAALGQADLSGASLLSTTFADTDLTTTKGLESCIHRGPSSVGIDTFLKSGGSIPESFLRGCGVPEQFIAYARSLVGHAIDFYSCFISYSSHDQVFAERLHADLLAKNLRCWFAPEDLKIGERFHERIEESIRLFDRVMIVLSTASVESRWVEREVNAAREREDRENRTLLFPIRIDDTVMNAPQPWAADIRRSRHIGDFREWKVDSSYQKAFARLRRDLEVKGRASAEPA